MPNHVLTEITIPCTREQSESLRKFICDAEGKVDFEVLLPVPANYWMGSVSSKHEAFPGNALAWCCQNWGTKWNAYGEREAIYLDGVLRLRFKTAWSAPLGWMCAFFNTAKVGFTYRYLDEGALEARAGSFQFGQFLLSDREWKEGVSPEDTAVLGPLLWGEESWAEIREA